MGRKRIKYKLFASKSVWYLPNLIGSDLICEEYINTTELALISVIGFAAAVLNVLLIYFVMATRSTHQLIGSTTPRKRENAADYRQKR